MRFCGECGHQLWESIRCRDEWCWCDRDHAARVTPAPPYRITSPVAPSERVNPLSPWFLSMSLMLLATVYADFTVGLAWWERLIGYGLTFVLALGSITERDRKRVRKMRRLLDELEG